MKSFEVFSKGFNSDIDITENIQKLLKGISGSGIMKVFSPGSTNALVIMRYEQGVIEDFKDTLESITSSSNSYKHQLTTNDSNGFAHMYSMLVGNYVLLPYKDNELLISDKHRIVLFDFDLMETNRTVLVDF
ncbi:YjbQ family protein [Salipaludibacillus sp. LMS25]|uniref:YjbQ family protein n=1 Tax=Salipaludibacillus sp. LMS25 TaxID=2924031 RepID=UPI0020D139B1|nr:YjbQ family protein [Salipaludibacillus sp. LMS25]UTR15951.1 YjbQ family protein [Salipaludibacillus sp. LMS25]